jgi:hypothetical protein
VVVGGPGEGVDGLARVSHDAQVGAVTDPQVQQPLLQGGDVLVLIDHEVAVLPMYRGCHLGVLLDDPCGQQQDILEVDRAPVRLDLLVHLQQPGDGRQVEDRRFSRPALVAAAW